MELWWASLDIYLKIMWGLAIPFPVLCKPHPKPHRKIIKTF